MAFWQYTVSNMNSLLEKQDVTPQEILSESDLLQELRNNSPKLIAYLLEPRILEQLVDMIIHDPDPQMDYKIQYKLPNTACEVLTFDIPAIKDALINSPQLLTKVCNVFRQEDALNDLTASFVCKLLIALATKRTDKFLDFIQSYDPDRYQNRMVEGDAEKADDEKPVAEAQEPQQQESESSSAFIDLLLNHINNSAIKDLINKMIECSENLLLRPRIVEWLASANLVPKLVAMLSADNSEQVITNSAKCLCKIVKVGREQQMTLRDKCPPDPLLASVEQVDLITEILDHAIPTGQDDLSAWTLFESNFVLLALLQYKSTTPCYQDIMLDSKCFLGLYSPPAETSPTLGELDTERAKEAIRKCLTAISNRLDALIVSLTQEQKERFGTVRLEIVKLIAAMVSCADEPSLLAIRDLKVLPIVLELFFNYPLCSQLHNQVDSIVQAICTPPKSQPGDSPGNDDSTTSGVAGSAEVAPPAKHVLFDQLFSECNLLEKIVQNYNTVPKDQKGYNGHLRLMANYIEAMSENSYKEYYEQLMDGLSPDFKQSWSSFKETLENVNNVYNKTVCPMNNAASCSEGDDPEDLRDMGVPSAEAIASAQQALNDYQMNMLTACSIDKFGFEDDEFTDVDIPGITNVASPPIEDHSSDEEDSGGENCDPWNKMDEGFNPWNLAGSSGGDETRDDWADFGSLKTELGGGSSAEASSPSGFAEQNDASDENWADFASYKQNVPAAPDGANDLPQQQAQPPQQQPQQQGSDDEF
ncbi:serine/threonine-protein phosphatase 6 regulatory subunit 3 [Galendromus occidentalis]|uniref:Serine/threonine-protein phosphatase 6 regulatory subunit 3 n=1 Tax=Galendromus occidentalis TaxID=34638 RepID=A0AAJ7WHV1_9ACAR|nr:serine/threonine-protein phosphatase 6 regulatory subunit 3 [Galendromus occidentalis]